MKIKVQSIHFTADAKLIDFIQKKMDKLETFNDKVIDAEVFLKLENDKEKGNKIVNIKLNLPGDEAFCTEQAPTFEEAVDNAYEILKRQLKRIKEKLTAH